MARVYSEDLRSKPKKRTRQVTGDAERGDSLQHQQSGSSLFSIKNAALLAVGLGGLGLAARVYKHHYSEAGMNANSHESSQHDTAGANILPKVDLPIGSLPTAVPNSNKQFFQIPGVETPEAKRSAYRPAVTENQEAPNDTIEALVKILQDEVGKVVAPTDYDPETRFESKIELLRSERHLFKYPPATIGILQGRSTEDTFGVLNIQNGGVYFVADGHSPRNNGEAQNVARDFAGPLLYKILTRGNFEILAELEIENSIAEVFRKTEEKLRSVLAESNGRIAGGTNISGFIYLGRRAAFFNIGDSVTGVFNEHGWRWKSSEHNKKNPAEVERGERDGGLSRELAVTRSLGDFVFKEKAPGVIPIADIQVINLLPGDKLIAVTDGITDGIPVEDIPRLVNDGKDLIRTVFDHFTEKFKERTEPGPYTPEGNKYFSSIKHILRKHSDKTFQAFLFNSDVDDMTYIVVDPLLL